MYLVLCTPPYLQHTAPTGNFGFLDLRGSEKTCCAVQILIDEYYTKIDRLGFSPDQVMSHPCSQYYLAELMSKLYPYVCGASFSTWKAYLKAWEDRFNAMGGHVVDFFGEQVIRE